MMNVFERLSSTEFCGVRRDCNRRNQDEEDEFFHCLTSESELSEISVLIDLLDVDSLDYSRLVGERP